MIQKILAAAVCVAGLATSATAQQYPRQPITIIVPAAPGGANDTIARMAEIVLRDKLGQPVIINNRPGVGGNLGALQAAQAKPDGYTLLTAANIMASSTLLFKNAGYDPVTAFSGISMIAETYTVVATQAKSPLQSIKDMIDEAKRRPGALAYSTGGVGSGGHVAAELLGKLAGISMNHIPYAGGAPTVTAALQGEVAVTFSPITNVTPFASSGDLRILAFAEKTRPARYATIGTINEVVPDAYVPPAWVSFFAPKGTPQEIVNLLSTTLRTGLGAPEMQTRIASTGFVSVLSDGATLDRRLAEDHEKWKQMIPIVGLKAE